MNFWIIVVLVAIVAVLIILCIRRLNKKRRPMTGPYVVGMGLTVDHIDDVFTCRRNLLQASCECGFTRNSMAVGYGRFSLMNGTGGDAPAYCLGCRELLLVNHITKPGCPKCGQKVVFYNEPILQRDPDTNRTECLWRGFRLPKTQFLCPRCGRKTMWIIGIGHWD